MIKVKRGLQKVTQVPEFSPSEGALRLFRNGRIREFKVGGHTEQNIDCRTACFDAAQDKRNGPGRLFKAIS